MTRGAVRQKSIACRAAAWATLCALLLSALWPAGFMPGAEAEDGAFTVVICSASGLKKLTLDASGNPVDENGQAESDSCVYWTAATHIAALTNAFTVSAAPRPVAERPQAVKNILLPPAIGPPLGAQAPPALLG